MAKEIITTNIGGIYDSIAKKHGLSVSYVTKINRGERPRNSIKAKAVVKTLERIKTLIKG